MTSNRFKPLLDREFLKGELWYQFLDYQNGGHDEALKARLSNWATRELKRETQAEASFVARFFVETWGYQEDGQGSETFNLHPKFPIAGAGQTGSRGEADLGIGVFGAGPEPQGEQPLAGDAGARLSVERPAQPLGQRAGPAALRHRHRHGRVPALSFGQFPGWPPENIEEMAKKLEPKLLG